MKKWDINKRPTFDFCPEQYCFCWTPPGGSADLSGGIYNSFEEAIEASKRGVIFLHGGCAAPFGSCKRATRNPEDKDRYEPHEFMLKKDGLPDLFFCDPENRSDEFMEEYKEMARKLWS
jgi:hypothetical protein